MGELVGSDLGCQNGDLYIDLNRAEDGQYGGRDNKSINVRKETPTTGQPEVKGCKKYLHTVENNGHISGIKYNARCQKFQSVNFMEDKYTGVCAYYLDYDDGNVIPLIVGLTKNGSDHKYYKKVKHESPETPWQEAYGVTPDGNGLEGKIDTICDDLDTVAVLKLDQYSGEYYANGDPSTPPEANKEARVQVSGPETVDGLYNKYEHRLQTDEEIRLLSTRNEDRYIPFKDPEVYTKEYSEASIYYWKEDESRSHPLLIELSPEIGSPTYYKLVEDVKNAKQDTKKWEPCQVLDRSNLERVLDLQNCTHNKAHQIRISEAAEKEYDCPGCSQKIKVTPTPNNSGYIHCQHKIAQGASISKFLDSTKVQTGLPSVKNVNSINVYLYPKGGMPLLIHYSSGGKDCWYRRDSLYKHSWTRLNEEMKMPTTTDHSMKILALLMDIHSPRVTIHIEKNDSGRYSGDDARGTIMYIKTDYNGSYYKVTHRLSNGTFFFIHSINVNGKTTGIQTKGLVHNVSAYFSRDSDKSGTPLLVEINRGSGSREYYSLVKNGDDVVWVREDVNEPEGTGKFDHELGSKLDAIYSKNFPYSNTAAIAIGVTIGACFAIIGAHEGVMMAIDPTRSLTMWFLSMTFRHA